MFIVTYTFYLKWKKEKQFIEAWSNLTDLINEYEEMTDSKLHVYRTGNYMLYTYWSDEITWREAGKNLPTSAEKWRKQLRESCVKIESSHQVEEDTDIPKAHLFM